MARFAMGTSDRSWNHRDASDFNAPMMIKVENVDPVRGTTLMTISVLTPPAGSMFQGIRTYPQEPRKRPPHYPAFSGQGKLRKKLPHGSNPHPKRTRVQSEAGKPPHSTTALPPHSTTALPRPLSNSTRRRLSTPASQNRTEARAHARTPPVPIYPPPLGRHDTSDHFVRAPAFRNSTVPDYLYLPASRVTFHDLQPPEL